MRFETLFCAGVLAICASLPAISFAQPSPDATARLQQVDDATLRDAGVRQAQEIRLLPQKLLAQGIVLSEQQASMIEQKADDFAIQASQPDFRQKVSSSVKKFGIETLKIVGYSGNVAFAASVAPPDFVVSFLQALFTGHDFDENSSSEDGTFVVESIGLGYIMIDELFYDAVGSAAIGVMVGSVSDLIVSTILCQDHNDPADQSELGKYCHENWTLMEDIVRASGQAGLDAGEGAHHGVVGIIHFVAKSARSVGDAIEHLLSRSESSGNSPAQAPAPADAPILN